MSEMDYLDPNYDDYLYRDYTTLGDEEKQRMNVDEVFAIYLNHVAEKVNQDFYDKVLNFILNFRDCVNQYGWEK